MWVSIVVVETGSLGGQEIKWTHHSPQAWES